VSLMPSVAMAIPPTASAHLRGCRYLETLCTDTGVAALSKLDANKRTGPNP